MYMQQKQNWELGLLGGHNQYNPTIEWWGCLGNGLWTKIVQKIVSLFTDRYLINQGIVVSEEGNQ